MPDIPVAGPAGGPYDRGMEARITRLEDDMRDVKSAVVRLEATTIEIKAMLAATLPHLATKAELAQLRADLPSKTYMWGILAVLLTAYACGLAGLAVLK
jgi:hypothetical protein